MAGTVVSLKNGGRRRSAVLQAGKRQADQLSGARAQSHLRHADLCGGARGGEHRRIRFRRGKACAEYAPWMVANFLLKRFPTSCRPAAVLGQRGVQRAGTGLCGVHPSGYPRAAAGKTVFSAYVALSDRKASTARLDGVRQAGRTAGAGQRRPETAYGAQFASCVERVDITLRGHAMAVPWPTSAAMPA
jgi:hypothetical protein